MERESQSVKLPLGSELPHFSLPNIDGRTIDSNYFQGSPASLVVFTCNHCPYVKGSEHLLIDVVKRFLSQGLKVVAINSNDPVKYPDDSFDKMKAKALDLKLPYPYLFDESQAVAKRFDAQCTPECFLFDLNAKLVFHGAINDSPRDSSKATRPYLADAVAAVIAGDVPEAQFVHPLGCSIKWK
jgi:peroxiredoxin